jgi:uncharacterized membrane protein YGL010W
MRRIDALFQEYASYHSTKGNLVCHSVGIPLIIFGVFSILLKVSLPLRLPWGPLTLAEVLLILATGYYLTLEVRIALVMFIVGLLFDLLARGVDNVWVGVAAFGVGWVFQGIGHSVYEKKAPAFFRNLVHLLVGPAFIVNKVLHLRPVPAPERPIP